MFKGIYFVLLDVIQEYCIRTFLNFVKSACGMFHFICGCNPQYKSQPGPRYETENSKSTLEKMRLVQITVFIFLFIIIVGVLGGRKLPRMQRALTNTRDWRGCQRGWIWSKSERKCVVWCNQDKGRFWSKYKGICVQAYG